MAPRWRRSSCAPLFYASASEVTRFDMQWLLAATENRTPWWLASAARRSTLLTTPTAWERGAAARIGDEDVAEALPGAGRLEGSVVETLRGESPDDPQWVETGQLDRDLSSARATRRGHRHPTRWIPTRGSSMHVSRSIPGCRRSGCLTRSPPRATPVATAACGTTSARCVHVVCRRRPRTVLRFEVQLASNRSARGA